MLPTINIEDHNYILEGNCFSVLPKLPENSVDLIFADPPYFLSNDGISCSGGKIVSVNKGKWDKSSSLKDIHAFNIEWIRLCKELLKPNGTLFISGTFHNIYSVGMALLENEFVILNNITWRKMNPPPNLSCRYFTHSTETIIWAKQSKKAKHTFNYDLMKIENGGKQMKDVWEGSCITKKEKIFGNHPTQKPLYLLERIIKSASSEGDVVLDPFAGSGTTLVAAQRLGRRFIGVEQEPIYCGIIQQRVIAEGGGFIYEKV